MTSTIALPIHGRKTLDHLIEDLKYALKDMTKEELFDILKKSGVYAAKVTYDKKKQGIKAFASLAQKTFKRYKNDGVYESFHNDMDKIEDFIISLPAKSKALYSKFITLNRDEQIELVIVTILTLAIFFYVGGGTDMEGGLPDTDIAIMGIGEHRNIVTHSILIGLGVEFAGRFSLNTLEKIKNRMPSNRHFIWDRVYGYMDKHKEKAVAAMWLGLGTHLLKDSGIFGHGVTSYKDLPFSMPIEGHQGLFAANGIASGLFASHV